MYHKLLGNQIGINDKFTHQRGEYTIVDEKVIYSFR